MIEVKKWHDRIIQAYDTGKFTTADKSDAAGWPTCAAIEFLKEKYPDKTTLELMYTIYIDTPLEGWGMRFVKAVCVDDVSMAHMLYHNMKRYVDKM
jgi:hypothetical protein